MCRMNERSACSRRSTCPAICCRAISNGSPAPTRKRRGRAGVRHEAAGARRQAILEPLALELAPARHPPFQPHHELGQHHAHEGDDDDRHEQLRGREYVGVFDDHAAEPADGGEELGDDDADDRQADREPDTRHDEGNRRRQNDLPKNLPFGGAIGSADLQHRAAHVADAGIGVHGDGEDGDRDQDRDLADEFQARPQDDQRDEGDARDGIERVDEGVEYVFQRAPLRHDDAERNADHDGERHADRERPQGLDQRLLERAVPDQLDRGPKDRARRRHEDRIHAAAVIFPHHEEDRDRGGANSVWACDNLAQALRPCRLRRRDRLARRHFRWRIHGSLLSISRNSARHFPKSGWVRTSPPPTRAPATGESTMVRIRPGAVWNTKMRSERISASSMLWVTKITVAPVRDHIARKSSCSCSRVCASSAPKGSSMKMRMGLRMSARAMPTRCCMPPDNSWGKCSAKAPSPTNSMKWRASSRRSAAPTPSISSGNSTLPITVRHGSRPKFWNTMQASLRGAATGMPSMVMRPSSAAMRPAVRRSKVVLPHPLGPSNVTSSPLRTLASTRSSATISSGRSFWPGRTRTGKNLLTPS